MTYWGWRPLLSTLFICVLITGCTITTATAPRLSPTSIPLVTLTLRIPATYTPTAPPTATIITTVPSTTPTQPPPVVDSTYVVRPGDTLLGIALDFGLSVDDVRAVNTGIDPLALQVGQIISIPPPRVAIAAVNTQVPLALEPPACHYLITGGLLCMGQVYNPYDQPLDEVRIGLKLLAADNTPLKETNTSLQQMQIPPQASAPYSAVLPIAGQEYGSVIALLVSARLVDSPPNQIQLDVVDEHIQQEHNRYRVTVTLRNATAVATGPARLILTITDQSNQVVGLRIITTPTGFEPGTEQTIQLESLTSAVDSALAHTLYIETQAVQ